jgi:sugar O-acyltransferase (sialic acid O-acetyltransferase NeuD family)
MRDLVILGAGGGSKSVHWLAESINEAQPAWNILGFLDENPALHGSTICGAPVLGGFDWLDGRHPVLLHGVGYPHVRRRFARLAGERGLDFVLAIAPEVRYSRFVTFGSGTVICTGSVLTSHISIGSHCLINLNCTIGHDTVMEDYCVLSPGVHVSGACRLEEGVDMGAGAVILPGCRIGRNSVIGAGSVVRTDIPPDSVAVGVPAQVIRTRTVAAAGTFRRRFSA